LRSSRNGEDRSLAFQDWKWFFPGALQRLFVPSCRRLELLDTISREVTNELAYPEPIAVDPQTMQEYVLVRKEIFQRFRSLLDADEPSMQEVALLVEKAMAEEDAGDPLLPSYQKYLEKP
jgi:hypothetical protein